MEIHHHYLRMCAHGYHGQSTHWPYDSGCQSLLAEILYRKLNPASGAKYRECSNQATGHLEKCLPQDEPNRKEMAVVNKDVVFLVIVMYIGYMF